MRHVNFSAAMTPVMRATARSFRRQIASFSLIVGLVLLQLPMSLVLEVCWKPLGDTATEQSPYKDDA